jgi:hypothetical protein
VLEDEILAGAQFYLDAARAFGEIAGEAA